VRVGKYEIPDMRLYPVLVEAVKKIYEKFKSEEATDTLTVAKLLGHKTDKSGAFLRKLACLRAYGLIDKRGIRVTEIGKKLTYGVTEEEKNEALKQAVLNIPLWKELFSKWGAKLPTENFWVDLAKITGLEAPDAQKLEEIVKKAYLDDVRYIKLAEKPKKEGIEVTETSKFETGKAILAPSPADKYANVLKVLIEEEAFEIAKNFIDHIEARAKAKKETRQKEDQP